MSLGGLPMQTAQPPVTTARHPLDPLSAEEIEAASALLRRERRLADTARFVFITLHEPDKATVLGFAPGDAIARRAFVIIRERAERLTYQAVVSITDDRRESWRARPRAPPALPLEASPAAPPVGAAGPPPRAGGRAP